MVWFNVDDGLTTNPKVLSIPRGERLAVIGLWSMAGSWCGKHLTDGAIPRFMLDEWGASEDQAQHLIDVGMWRKTSKGYQFLNWDEYQQTKQEVEEKRRKERERKDRYRKEKADREANGPNGVPAGVPVGQDVGREAESDPPIPSLPFPSLPIPINASRGDAKPSRKKPELPLPESWAPTAEHVKRARERGVDLVAEVENFRLHAETHDRRAANWNGAFTMWLNRSRPVAVVAAAPEPQSELEEKRRVWLSARGIPWEEYLERKDEPGWLESVKALPPREVAHA